MLDQIMYDTLSEGKINNNNNTNRRKSERTGQDTQLFMLITTTHANAQVQQ